MSEIVHAEVSGENTLTLPATLGKIFKDKEIPDELDIVIINRKPKDFVEKILGSFDFDNELLDKVEQLEWEAKLLPRGYHVDCIKRKRV